MQTRVIWHGEGVGKGVAITQELHEASAADKHALNDQFCPFEKRRSVFYEQLVLAVINLKKSFAGRRIYIQRIITGNTYKGHPLLCRALALWQVVIVQMGKFIKLLH